MGTCNLKIGKSLVRLYRNLDYGTLEVWEKNEETWKKILPRISKTSGYIYYMIDGDVIYMQALIMAWICGWDKVYIGDHNEIHHLNRDRLDNRFSNLICLKRKDHHRLHVLEDRLKNEELSEEDRDEIEDEKDMIIREAVLLKERCRRRRGRKLALRRKDDVVD